MSFLRFAILLLLKQMKVNLAFTIHPCWTHIKILMLIIKVVSNSCNSSSVTKWLSNEFISCSRHFQLLLANYCVIKIFGVIIRNTLTEQLLLLRRTAKIILFKIKFVNRWMKSEIPTLQRIDARKTHILCSNFWKYISKFNYKAVYIDQL